MVTVPELADMVGRDVTTIRRHCHRGLIPGAEKPGHDWFIPLEGAEQYAERYVPYQALRKVRT